MKLTKNNILIASGLMVSSLAMASSALAATSTTTVTVGAGGLLVAEDDDINTTSANAIEVGAAVDGISVTIENNASVTTTTSGVGINVASGSSSNIIEILAGGTLATASESIVFGGGSGATLTIINDGSIATSTTNAIDASAASAAVTHSGGGDVSGSIVTGSGADSITTSGSAAVTGNITTGSGADTVTLGSSAAVTGNVSLGAGNDTLNISGTGGVTGTIDGGTGTDAINISANTTTGGAISNVETITTTGAATLDVGHSLGGAAIALNSSGALTFNAASQTSVITAGAAATAVDFDGGDATVTGTLINAAANTAGMTIDVQGGSAVTGNIILGSGNDTVNINADDSGSTFTGGITGAAGGTDTVNLDADYTSTSSAKLTALDALNVGANAATVLTLGSAATITTTTFTNGSSLVVNSGGSLSGAIAGDGDLTFNTGFTAGGNINADDITINSGIFNMNSKDITGSDTITVADGATMTVNGDITYTTAFNVSGTVNFADTEATTTLTAGGELNATSGTIQVNIASVTSATNVDLGGADLVLDDTTLHVVVNTANAASIATGDAWEIFTDAGSITSNGLVVTDNSALVSFAYADDSVDVTLTATVANIEDTIASNNSGVGAGAVLSALGTGGDSGLDSVYTTALTLNSAQLNNFMSDIAPDASGGAAAGTASAQEASFGTVETRINTVKSRGVATGDGYMDNAFWLQGFGGTAEQDAKDGKDGYDSDTAGIALGADGLYDAKTRVGLGFAYTSTSVENSRNAATSTDIDGFQLIGYGSRDYDTWFLDTMAAVSFNEYDSNRNISAMSENAKAEYSGTQYSFKVAAGKNMEWANGTTFTPKASLFYSHVETDGYTENGSSSDMTVSENTADIFKLGVSGKLSRDYTDKNGMVYTPSVNAGITYDPTTDAQGVTASFVGGGTAFNTYGADAEDWSARVGLGLEMQPREDFTVNFKYDLDFADSFTSHNVVLNGRWKF